MKNTGLQNRFSPKTRAIWIYWYSCLVCGMNGIDALHHIVSPSSHLHKNGDFNNSVYNSCPIHNMKCHIGNETLLYKDETIKMLLKKTRDALHWEGHVPDKNDLVFLKEYAHLYV